MLMETLIEVPLGRWGDAREGNPYCPLSRGSLYLSQVERWQ
jgi:hypothetical protein